MKHISLMVFPITLLLVVLWFKGTFASSSFGGFLHALLMAAMVSTCVVVGRVTRSWKVMVQ